MSAQPIRGREDLPSIAQAFIEPVRASNGGIAPTPGIILRHGPYPRLVGGSLISEPHPDLVPSAAMTQSLAIESHLRDEFNALAECWHKETRYWSSATKMAMHPAYQRIISLGEEVIPYILDDLQRTHGHWLWALHILSEFHDPATEGATFDEAVDAWLNWGRQQGLLK
ncbi:MAG: hypothetical protein AABO57_26970 [Acidobacteriota bacterium]